jgi:hypothetical protein
MLQDGPQDTALFPAQSGEDETWEDTDAMSEIMATGRLCPIRRRGVDCGQGVRCKNHHAKRKERLSFRCSEKFVQRNLSRESTLF